MKKEAGEESGREERINENMNTKNIKTAIPSLWIFF